MSPLLPDPSAETTKARNVVYRQLKIRHRSEKEVRTKLLRKEFSRGVIDDTIRYFKSLDFIDDRKFAKAWIQSRLKKPFGVRRIRLELKEKGIDETIVNDEMERALSQYSEDDVVSQLAQKRWRKHNDIETDKRKRRLFEYLARRGFNTETILKVIRQIAP